jgi:hypothetical protein
MMGRFKQWAKVRKPPLSPNSSPPTGAASTVRWRPALPLEEVRGQVFSWNWLGTAQIIGTQVPGNLCNTLKNTGVLNGLLVNPSIVRLAGLANGQSTYDSSALPSR